MKPFTLLPALSLILASLFLGTSAQASSIQPGALQVVVTDEKGSYAPNSQIYIFGVEAGKLIETRTDDGIASFALPPGTYRIYSAASQDHAGFVDHFVSPEAQVVIAANDSSSVILKLRQAENNVIYLSENTRKKMGITPELARYLN